MSGKGRPGDVLQITVLQKQPRSDEALLLLKKIASVSPSTAASYSSVFDWLSCCSVLSEERWEAIWRRERASSCASGCSSAVAS